MDLTWDYGEIGDLSGFLPRHDKYVGRFFMSPSGSVFHSLIDCSSLGGIENVAEVSIVDNPEIGYMRAGTLTEESDARRGKIRPCPRCNPLGPQVSVHPLGHTDIPCAGRDDEWVFHIRPQTSPEKIYDAQRECMQCPALEECFHNFLQELPVYGVMGGVTYRQYREYGPKVLDVMRERIANEDTSNIPRATQTEPGSGAE